MSSAQDKAGYGQTATGGPAPAGGSAPGTGREAGYAEAGYERGYGGGGGGSMSEAGGTILAATLMILSGLWSFFVGLTAIIKQSFYVATPNNVYQFSVHGWGWVHLILGVVLFAAGVCVLLGQTWAKALGIVLAVFSGIAYFLFLPYYPLWAIIVIAIDVFIVWALATSMARGSRVA
jgi:hypothetical protein